MRRNVSLYIAGMSVDLDEQSFILFNYTMEDLSNPTIVRNSFSKQVTLPGSANNDKIFGHIFRLDRETQYGSGMTGADFDVARRTPFVIYNEMNEIIEQGYIKLDEVVRAKNKVEYKVTLYGGLGSFFYQLMFGEDGAKKTLADFRYAMVGGGYTKAAGHFGQIGGYEMVQDCWSYLSNPEAYDVNEYECWWANIINFAPCYNGLPSEFSADKAVVNQTSFNNLPTLSPKSGASSNLMQMTNAHTEWEIKDLRWYLQRPIFRVKALFDAICDKENNGGYDVILDASFFNKSHDLYWNGWITLPLIPSADRQNADAIVKMLSSTLSPAEYLISFAKVFGLVFYLDKDNTITILPRKEFFLNEQIDLSSRVNSQSISIKTLLADTRYYQFGSNAIGEWAKAYKEDFERDYGIQKVNTGNEYNNETTIVTEGIQYKDAADVQERSLLYVSEFNDRDGSYQEILRLPKYERVFIQQWSNDTMTEEDVAYNGIGSWFYNNLYFPLSDWLPKVQMHEGNKAVDGANILMIFNGNLHTPEFRSWARLQYRLSDDTTDMLSLNDGVPCWNLTNNKSIKLSSLPSFRRCRTELIPNSGDETIIATYEWGEPLARGVNGSSMAEGKVTIYDRFWKEYQRDRYDADTFIMQCKVNLSGLQVGQGLMRKFFYYQGAIFVLNKITNHSLTTWDDTECEFIKVQDINNYIG